LAYFLEVYDYQKSNKVFVLHFLLLVKTVLSHSIVPLFIRFQSI